MREPKLVSGRAFHTLSSPSLFHVPASHTLSRLQELEPKYPLIHIDPHPLHHSPSIAGSDFEWRSVAVGIKYQVVPACEPAYSFTGIG